MRLLPEEKHSARPGREDTEAAGEQRRLPAARGAEQPVDGAVSHVEREPVQHGGRGLHAQATAVAEAHVLENDGAHLARRNMLDRQCLFVSANRDN